MPRFPLCDSDSDSGSEAMASTLILYLNFARKRSARAKSACKDHCTSAIMALYQRAPYTTADRENLAEDVSDQEEAALAEDYKEQVQFDEGMSELDRTGSLGVGGPQDMQAQLAAAATPLEYGAPLDTKFASYDNYCNLFHYILNSEGPVDLEVPTVSHIIMMSCIEQITEPEGSTTGHGT